jgi:hypothetical protein
LSIESEDPEVPASIRRDEQPSIADEFFLIALDDRTGKPRLHSRALSLGVAAGLLSELVLSDYIAVVDAVIRRIDARQPPVDPTLTRMLEQIDAEQPHPVPTWLSFFAQTSVPAVASRLVHDGYLRVEESRSLLRKRSSYTSTNPTAHAWRAVRLGRLITNRKVATWEDTTVAGLCSATGLATLVLWDATSADHEYLGQLVAALAQEPSLRALINQVEALVAAAVLAPRT